MSVTFADALDRYELYARAISYSRAQIRLTRFAVGLLARFLEPTTDIQEMTRDDFLRFLADLQIRPARKSSGKESGHPLSKTTVNTYARNIKAFFVWLSNEGIITENPTAKVPAPRLPTTVPKVYSEDDLIKVSKTVTGLRDRAIYELFLDSGMRLQELSKLDIKDVNTKKGFAIAKGKGGKERPVYFTQPVSESLEAYLKDFRSEA